MQRGIDELISDRLPEGDAPREILEAYRLVAADAGWSRRVGEAIRQGLSAEAAVHRVGGELRDRMRRIVDPYLRERLADLEDLGNRLLSALTGDGRRRSASHPAPSCSPAVSVRPTCWTGMRAASAAW